MSQIHGIPRILDPRPRLTRIGPAKTAKGLSEPATPAVLHSYYTQAVTAAANAIDWYDFLARPGLPGPAAEALDRLRDARIVVTGAGGSIGSALSLRLASLGPRRLLLLDSSEQALYRLQVALAEAGSLADTQPILGNTGNRGLLDEILAPRQIIFHAAAYKHVPLLEENPLEAIANNALATLTLAEAALRAGAARIVLLSTDKAAAPASILGASKRIAERVVLARGGVAARLGNVLGTEGGVSETFARQIAAGAPVTVTAPDAERYFLTCAEAVDLLAACAVDAPSGSLLAPQLLRRHRIVDLAQFLSKELAPAHRPLIAFTGKRPGDKPQEVFYSADELASPSSIGGVMKIEPKTHLDPPSAHHLEILREAVRRRDLTIALDCLTALVPGYTPSDTILAQLRPWEVRR